MRVKVRKMVVPAQVNRIYERFHKIVLWKFSGCTPIKNWWLD
ncbi:hypothetical protein EBME_1972 [bacterium endosymbiont of Mortierella elongata FMR23-6]|nr:hypothetical protein EBME_1972 [bacterium endosymbiont of Mortierella elongata FMR23-6]